MLFYLSCLFEILLMNGRAYFHVLTNYSGEMVVFSPTLDYSNREVPSMYVCMDVCVWVYVNLLLKILLLL